MSDYQWKDCPVVIPYYGGKFQLSRELIPRLPKHERYIEMFAGGLSMFFRKKKVEWNIINDKDNNLVNLYITLAEDFESFCEHIKWYIKSRTYHELIKEYVSTYKSPVQPTDIPDAKRAARYYYLVKCSFNNNPQGTFSKNSADWNTDVFVKDLRISRKYLNNVTVENLDFRVLVDKYIPKEGDLWYLDPPYYVASKRKDYYIHTFGNNDHLDLFTICNKINDAGAKFMVSYDDNKNVHILYKNYRIEKIPVIYAGQTTKREYKNEIVVTNYEPPAVQETMFDGE